MRQEPWHVGDHSTPYSQPDEREMARDRIARLLSGHNHLDGLVWSWSFVVFARTAPRP
jgi:hypothetical protein